MSCSSCGKQSVFEQGKAILEGTKNYLFEDKEIESIAKPRLEKCITCPLSRILIRVGSNVVRECTKCKCLCELKARVVNEVCPDNRW